MNILITGSKGFIGKNLIRYLKANSNHNIFEFSREDLFEDRSKLECEKIIIELKNSNKNEIAILRLPGIFGMGCKPNYNSVVATFCFNTINNISLNIIDPNKEIEIVFIEDLCKQLAFLIENNSYQNIYVKIENINKVTIEYLAKKIKNLKYISSPSVIKNDLEKKLYKTFLSYKT